MKEIVYVTGNKFKILSAKKILEPLGIKVLNKKLDIPEIQADTIEDVAKHSSIAASKKLNVAALKNDSGLVISALKNFPSAYSKYVEETISEEGILKLMEGVKDRRAYFLEVLAYTEVDKEPIIFVSKTEGLISNKASGNYGWGYDKIFVPKGQDNTLATFNDDERWKLWDDSAYKKLAEYLKKED